jgi:hypothetical protein
VTEESRVGPGICESRFGTAQSKVLATCPSGKSGSNSSAGPFRRRHRDRFDYLFDFATIPLIFETTPTFLPVFLFSFVFDFFVSRSVKAFAFSAVSLTTAASLPAVLPMVVAAFTSAPLGFFFLNICELF